MGQDDTASRAFGQEDWWRWQAAWIVGWVGLATLSDAAGGFLRRDWPDLAWWWALAAVAALRWFWCCLKCRRLARRLAAELSGGVEQS